MSALSLRTGLACAFIMPVWLAAQTPLPKQSPFAPAGAPVTAETASETLEFAGVTSIGKKTEVIIHDKTAKRKHWISIGETVEGISVVRYDPALEQAFIRVNGTDKTLPLRKAATAPRSTPAPVAVMHAGFSAPPQTMVQNPALASGSPEIVAAPTNVPTQVPPPVPAGPPTPQTQARAETEARMLVSDLLEIGMAQRKAYEEAQRKAAGGPADPQGPANAPQAAPAPQSQPTPPGS